MAPHPNFKAKYPKSSGDTPSGLALVPVSTGPGVQHAGFDEDDVKAALGVTRFNSLSTLIAAGAPYSGSVFSCGHRTKPAVGGVEVHCIYASDLELFLKNGG